VNDELVTINGRDADIEFNDAVEPCRS